MIFVNSFLIGGTICLLAQLISDAFKLAPVHITSIFICLGSLLNVGNIYDKLIVIGGNGAKIPISSFGHSLTHAALEEASRSGYMGILSGMFSMTSSGITMAIIFAFVFSLIFKAKD